jgi:HEAT repeat protein
MAISQKVLALALGACLLSSSAEMPNKNHIAYLMQCHRFSSSIELYQEYRKAIGKHDFDVLQQMALILLEQGALNRDPEKQLLSIFGSGIAGIASCFGVLEEGIASSNSQTQMAAIQFLARLQDDRSDELLNKAMSSEYFFARLEAAYQLSMRKAKTAAGQIEALMYRVPHQLRFFFPEFFALIGTADAIGVLRHLMDDTQAMVRVEAILSAARHGRDDLLPQIRTAVTHLNGAEQEACAAALGSLKDSGSLPTLQKLADSPSSNVRLAALRSLYHLGQLSAKERVIAMAKEQNLFAINLLAEMSDTQDTLAPLLLSENIQVRLNAAIALLKHRDSRAVGPILEILIRDTRDLGMQPQFSVGNSLVSWKIVPSVLQHMKEAQVDLQAITLGQREKLLKDCLELSERDFLFIARRVLDSKQTELVPVLVNLLENLQTPEAIQLLKDKARQAGQPLLRIYCNLALFRLKQPGSHEQVIREWLVHQKDTEMIRFRPQIPWSMRMTDSHFDLTPEENSRLLIEACEALAGRHDEKSIDTLLEMISTGHANNRYVLAGLLIHAIQ